MSIVYTDDQHYSDIATALRTKLGVQTQFKPEDMANAILDDGNISIVAELKNNGIIQNIVLPDGKSSCYISGTSTGNFLKLQYNGADLSVNLSTATSWRICVKFMFTSQQTSTGGGAPIFFGNTQNIYYSPAIEGGAGYVGVGFNTTGSTSSWAKWLQVTANIEQYKWYYVVLSWKSGTGKLSLYNADGELIGSSSDSVGAWYNRAFTPVLGGTQSSNWWNFSYGKLGIAETFIQLDDNYVWGTSNAKTKNMGIITD